MNETEARVLATGESCRCGPVADSEDGCSAGVASIYGVNHGSGVPRSIDDDYACGRVMVPSGRGEGASGRGAMALRKGRFCRVETADGQIEEIELEIALLMSPNLYRQVACHGSAPSHKFPSIVLPKQVTPDALKLIMEYCRFHQAPGRSDKERKIYDEKFIRTLDTKKLCEMASAADSLKMSPLVELTCQALAKMIEGKTPEEVREIFHLPDDLTEEEKLEPMKNSMGDPRIRLLNRLYARKRKELYEKRNVEPKTSVSTEQAMDHRSVDDLLSFIDGEKIDEPKSKKGPRRRKKRNKDRSSDGLLCHSDDEDDNASTCKDSLGGRAISSSPDCCVPSTGSIKYVESVSRFRGKKVRQESRCKPSNSPHSRSHRVEGVTLGGPAASSLGNSGGRVMQHLDWQDLLKMRHHGQISFTAEGNGMSLHNMGSLHDLKHIGQSLIDTEAVARMLNDEDDFDDDDGLDPVLREQIDKEVEDFAKRLNVEQRWSLRPN